MSKMKRNEHHVKQSLKKEKALRLRREAVKAEMVDFLCEVHYAQLPQPLDAVQNFLRSGWKGYDKLRGKQLVRAFEEEQVRLNGKGTIMFYTHERTWRDEVKTKSNHQEKTRREFIDRASAITNKLLEIAFKLEEE